MEGVRGHNLLPCCLASWFSPILPGAPAIFPLVFGRIWLSLPTMPQIPTYLVYSPPVWLVPGTLESGLNRYGHKHNFRYRIRVGGVFLPAVFTPLY